MKNLTLKVPEELHKTFKVICVKENRSMKDIVLSMIEDYCKNKEKDWDNFMKAWNNAEVEEPENLTPFRRILVFIKFKAFPTFGAY